MLERQPRCQACPLHRGCRSPGIILSGEPGGILVIGLYPGYFEDQKGDLFCGKSGRQLRFYMGHLVAPLQIPVAYANLVGCRLPKGAKLGQDNVVTCWGKWDRLGPAKPRLILCAGQEVARFLLQLPKLRVNTSRGRTYYLEGTPVIVTNNPAKAEYEKSNATYHAIQEDIRRAIKILSGEHQEAPEFHEVSQLRDSDTLVIDLETTGLDAHRDKPVLGGAATLDNPTEIQYERDFLQLPVPNRVVGWNFSFDSQWLPRAFSRISWVDGMLLHGLLYPDAAARGLKIVGPQYTGVEYPETLDDMGEIEDGPRLRRYLGMDIYQTAVTTTKLLKELETHPSKNLFPWLMRLARTTAGWTHYGVHLDRKELERLCHSLRESQRESIAAMERIARAYNLSIGGKEHGWTFHRSTKAIQKLLFEYLALPITRTEKGNPSLDEATRQKLEPLDPTGFVKLLGQFSADQKLVGTYVAPYLEEPWLDNQDRIHPTPYLVQRTREALAGSDSQGGGTITGRVVWSHRLQLLPPSVRGIVATRYSGGAILSLDLSQIEPRVIAWLSQEPVLLENYRSGRDIYVTYMTIALGCNPADVTPELRAIGKTVVLAILYGAGASKIQEVFRLGTRRVLPLGECEDILRRLTRGLPRLMAWKESIVQRLEKHLPVITSTGRARTFPVAYEEEHVRQAINFPVQSFASDINHTIAMEVSEQCHTIHPMFTVHDSVVMDCENRDSCEDIAQRIWDEAAYLVKRDFGLDFDVPIKYSVKKGERWS